MLVVDRISKSFRGLSVLKGISLSVRQGEWVGCVGPNSAGKTTLLNLISGLNAPDHGIITIAGRPLLPSSPAQAARLGVGRAFQVPKLFRELTVTDHFSLASSVSRDETLTAALFARQRWQFRTEETAEHIRPLLEALQLWALRNVPASMLSGGQLRLLDLALATFREPRLLLLDEPITSISPDARLVAISFLQRLKREGGTALIVDHDFDILRRLVDRLVVLSQGEVISQGPSNDPEIWTAAREACMPLSATKPNAARAQQISHAPHQAGARSLLSVRGLRVAYGAQEVLRGVSLDIYPGEIVGMVGGNGAGKSTFLGALLGRLPLQGVVSLNGRRIDALPPDAVNRSGLSSVPQHRKVFPALTVRENLQISMETFRERRAKDMEEVLQVFPELRDHLNRPAGQLSGGLQQALGITRALAESPCLLLLDEPAAGLARGLLARLGMLIIELARSGVSVLIVEHTTALLEQLAPRTCVLSAGLITYDGPWSGYSLQLSKPTDQQYYSREG
jgi:branched-chain amino acid transport system ATP-binding protein